MQEYVQQGGNLLIAAGVNFDPALWTSLGWKRGLGILPAPLDPVIVEGRAWHDGSGKRDASTDKEIQYDQLDFSSMQHHDYFLPDANSRETLEELYAKPYFFRAAKAITDKQTIEAMPAAIMLASDTILVVSSTTTQMPMQMTRA